MPALIDDDVVSAFAVVGPVQQVPELLAARCAGVVDRGSFLAQPPPLELVETLTGR